MIKRNMFRYSSVLMCVVLTAASLVGCSTTTASVDTGTDTATVVQLSGNTEETLTDTIGKELSLNSTSTLANNTRQETVYVFADANGTQDHITVNEKVTDASGNESLNKTTSTQSAPISMKVTYYLDGKEMSAADMAGKSGKVTIRFDYTNNQKKTVTIDGKEQTVCVPFTMITGMLLPTDVFSNVEVTNGKLTKVGDNVVALGMTMPGLSDTLNLKFGDDTLDMDIPDYFELTADVVNFSLDMTMSVATSNLLTDIDVDDLTLDDLQEQMASMEDAATQLSDGTVSLQDGTQKLSDALPALTEGVTKLDTGALNLKDGIYSYTQGVLSAYEGSVTLNDSMTAYANGIGTLYNTLKDNNLDTSVQALATGASSAYDGSVELNDGIKRVSEGLDTLATGLVALSDGAVTLAAGTDSLKSKLEGSKEDAASKYKEAYDSFYKIVSTITYSTIAAQYSANGADVSADEVKSAIDTATVKALADKGLAKDPDVTSETQYSTAVEQAVEAIIKANAGSSAAATSGDSSDTTASTSTDISANSSSDSSAQIATQSDADTTNATLQAEALKQIITITCGLAQAHQAYYDCNTTLESLESNDYFTGVETLTAGINKVSDGATELQTGVSQLSSGSSSLTTGLGQLSTGLNTLSTSVGTFTEYKEGTLCSSLYALNLNASKLQSEGTAALAGGLSQITANNSALNDGATQLSDGTSTLKSSSVSLTDGVTQLNAGAITLRDGMAQFNSEAIEPISSLVNGDATTALDTIKAVILAGQEYDSFLGKSDDKTGSVTFVYKTEGIN